MSWFTKAMSSSLGRKLIMAATGLFLIIFLVVHLIGNLQLLADDKGEAFNIYSRFMTTNPGIKTISYLLYAVFIIHIIWSIILTVHNRKSRPIGYAVNRRSTNSTWSSRNMGILGTIIFIFLVVHLENFWYQVKFGSLESVQYGGQEYEDLYTSVAYAFSQLWIVILYVLSMIALMFHLFHGFRSAFQTLGMNHPKYNRLIRVVGTAFAIIVPALFAAIPILMYVQQG